MGQDGRVEFHRVSLSDPRVAPVLDGLAGEYERRYGPVDEMSSVQAHEFEPPDGTFLILIEDGVVVAGGGIRRISEEVCEVKRMWTSPDHRRQGYASAVLEALEQEARNLGYAVLRLETGPAQPEAHGLYDGRGYTRIPTYGRYARATAFEHRLGDGPDAV
jgi:GNAT superfamily N-acetyltransferase